MTVEQAKETLLLHRPGAPPLPEQELAAALRLLETDPELAAWYDAHQQLHHKIRTDLRSIEPPPALRERILRQAAPARNVVSLPLWRRRSVVLALAAMLLLVGLIVVLWETPSDSESFGNFQARMISAALRQYGMDIETNDMAQVRQFMASRGAPADYELTPGLLKAELAGGAFLKWRSRPVSMVCFRQANGEMLWLLVMEAGGLHDAPPAAPELSIVRDVSAASWSKNGKVYVLAGASDTQTLKRFL